MCGWATLKNWCLLGIGRKPLYPFFLHPSASVPNPHSTLSHSCRPCQSSRANQMPTRTRATSYRRYNGRNVLNRRLQTIMLKQKQRPSPRSRKQKESSKLSSRLLLDSEHLLNVKRKQFKHAPIGRISATVLRLQTQLGRHRLGKFKFKSGLRSAPTRMTRTVRGKLPEIDNHFM